MAGTLSTDTAISTMIGNYYDHVFLERLESNLVYDKWGEQRPLPENQGNTIVWHALQNAAVGYSVGEGSSPAASAVSARTVSATLENRADLRSISDVIDMQAVCPVVKETVEVLGYGAALTKDQFVADKVGFGSAASTGVSDAASVALPSVFSQGFPVLEGNSNTTYWPDSNGIATALHNGYFSTIATIAHVREAVTHLRKLAAMPYEDGNYRGVIDPQVSDHIRQDSNWPTWNAYANLQGALQKGRLGVIEQVMFEESPKAIRVPVTASAWSTTYTVSGGSLYGTLIFGKQAYGVTKLGAKDAKVQVVEGADKQDPLNQYTLVGYKMYLAAKILNPSAGVILTWYDNGQ